MSNNKNNSDWYSIATPNISNIQINTGNEDKLITQASNHNAITFQSGVCEFCLKEHKRYSELLNNICQVCGKAATFITNNSQTQIPEKIVALNERLPLSDEGEMAETFGAVSLDFDYCKITKNPYTDISNVPIEAYNASDAIRKLNEVERRNSTIYSAQYNGNVKYRLKTNV